MSKRKAKQRRSIETRKAQGRTERKTRDRTWSITFLTATPALLVGVVVIWLMLGVTSSLSAIRLVELRDMQPPLYAHWRDGFLQGVYWKQPHAVNQRSVRILLQTLEGVEDGSVVRSVAVQSGREELAAVPDNLLARLLCACIFDEQLAADQADAASRYASFEKIVEGQNPATFATLYNAEFLSLWHEYVARRFERQDVAASIVGHRAWASIDDHLTALPKMQRRVSDLAAQLRTQGHEEEAQQCHRAFAKCLAMLMRSEHDVATITVCADLLSHEFDADSEPARKLQALRADFRTAAAAAPIDIFDQSGGSQYALAPGVYNRSLYSLLGTLVCLAVAAGASLLFALTVVIAPIARLLAKEDAQKVEPKRRSVLKHVLWACAPAVVAMLIVLPHFGYPRFFSDAWLYVAAIVLMAFATLAPIAVASLAVRHEPPVSRRCMALSILPAMMAAMFFLMPASTVAWGCRSVDLTIGTPVTLLVPCIAVAIAVGLFMSPARMRHVAAHAARVMLVGAVLSLAIWGYHRVADKQYQQSVVSLRFDEMTARLGEGWRAKYLQPAFDVCGVPLR